VPLGREMARVDVAVHSLLVGTLIVVGACLFVCVSVCVRNRTKKE